MDSNLQFEFSNPSSNLGISWHLKNLSQHFHGKFTKIKIIEERITNSTMFCMASQFTTYFNENFWWHCLKITTKFLCAGNAAGTFWVIGKHDNDYNKKFWQYPVNIFLIMLNWSITKKWKFVNLKFIYRRQFTHSFYKQNCRVVKAMDC